MLGIVILVGAFWHYLHVSRAIEAESYRPSTIAMGVTSAAIVVMAPSPSSAFLSPRGNQRRADPSGRRRAIQHAHQLGLGHSRLVGCGERRGRIEGDTDGILAEGVVVK